MVGGPVIVVHAPRWRDKVHSAVKSHDSYRVEWVEEGEGELSFPYPMRLRAGRDRYSNRGLMSMLLKPELMALAKPFGAKSKHTVEEVRHIVHENLTGRQIRLGTMAALRARHFGWICDEPTSAPAEEALATRSERRCGL
jgi:hypothetical protein